MKDKLIQIQSLARQYWQARNRREQLILAGGGLVLLLSIYAFCLQSLHGRIETLRKRLPELTLNSYEMAAGTRNQPAAPTRRDEDLRSELFRRLADQGVSAELRGLSADRVEMTLAARPAAELLNSLNTLRLAAGARVASLQLRAQDEAGLAAATVIMERRR